MGMIADVSNDPAPPGDGFRVTAHVLLRTSALLRGGCHWCACVVECSRVHEAGIGHRNPSMAEVRGRLQHVMRPIIFPKAASPTVPASA